MPQAAIPIAAAVAGGVASAGAAKLFGGSSSKGTTALAQGPLAKNLSTPGFTLGVETLPGTGRTIGFGNRSITLPGSGKRAVVLRRTAETEEMLRRLGLLSEDRAQKIGGLLERVAPGFSEFRRAGLGQIGNARRRTIGDIRDNLARRRVLGSSFAQDAIARADREFADSAALFASQTTLQELEKTFELITAQTRELQSAAARELDQANFEIQAAANFANGVNVVSSGMAQTLAALEQNAAAGAGQFFAPVIQGIGDAVSTGITNAFKPSDSSGSTALVGNYNAGFT